MANEQITRRNIDEFRDILLEMKVPAKNISKYYHFKRDNPDAKTFLVKYGRIGTTSNDMNYPAHSLFNKFSEKIKKGYQIVGSSKFTDESTASFQKFLDDFLGGGDDCWLPE